MTSLNYTDLVNNAYSVNFHLRCDLIFRVPPKRCACGNGEVTVWSRIMNRGEYVTKCTGNVEGIPGVYTAAF